MKLLFDQNISFRIVKSIQHIFPGSVQVKEAGLQDSTDKQIWDYARTKGFTIVTFDADFSSMGALYGQPPKIIWLRTGNTNTNELVKFLEAHAGIIKDFITSPDFRELSCLELG